MAGDASWKGSLAIGPMLRFEVAAKAANREIKVGGFNMHHAGECFGQFAQTYNCLACGETNLSRADSTSGYQGIPVDTEAFKSLAAERTDTIELDGLIPAGSIDTRWVQKSYDLIPGKGAEKAYALIRTVLERSDRIGIGKIVMRGYEYIVTVRAREGALAMELCYWPDEVNATGSLDQALGAAGTTTLSDNEIGMGMALAEMLSTDFEPSQYVNEVAVRKAEYLAQLVETGEAPTVAAAAPVQSKVVSLEDALAASIAAMGAAKAAAAAPKAKKGKKAA